MRQFNIGLDTLVCFLRTQGVWVEEHPNAKVPDTVLPALHMKFGHDKEMAGAASKTAVRISTIVGDNKGKKKVVAPEKKHQPISTHRTRKPSPKPENSTIPIAPQREYAKRVKIKAINRPHRIITDGFDGFKAGVLFPKDILYKGQPIAIANAEALINSRFRVGDIIHCRVVGTSPDRHIAYLSCEISGFNLSGLDGFETVAPGAKYPVRLIGT